MLLSRGTKTHTLSGVTGVSYGETNVHNIQNIKIFGQFWIPKYPLQNIFSPGIYKKALCSQSCEVWGVTGNWISSQGRWRVGWNINLIRYTKPDIFHRQNLNFATELGARSEKKREKRGENFRRGGGLWPNPTFLCLFTIFLHAKIILRC